MNFDNFFAIAGIFFGHDKKSYGKMMMYTLLTTKSIPDSALGLCLA